MSTAARENGMLSLQNSGFQSCTILKINAHYCVIILLFMILTYLCIVYFCTYVNLCLTIFLLNSNISDMELLCSNYVKHISYHVDRP